MPVCDKLIKLAEEFKDCRKALTAIGDEPRRRCIWISTPDSSRK